jgi:hypothetical protein
LFGKVKVPMTDEDYDMESEEGNKLTIPVDTNAFVHTEQYSLGEIKEQV